MSGFRQLADVLSSWTDCEVDPQQVRRKPRRRRVLTEETRRDACDSLARTIEGEIIPRLMLAHQKDSKARNAKKAPSRRITEDDVSEFSRLIIEHDGAVALEFVRVLQSKGLGVDKIYVDLLAASARLLGEWWRQDVCDFADVTIGLSRLQQFLHEVAPRFDDEVVPEVPERRVLLIPTPGEQHTFGIMLVEEIFRRSGWLCCSGMPRSKAELARSVRNQWFEAIGLSVSSIVLLENVASAIQTVRSASQNKNVVVVVGGPVFLDNPEFAKRVGADFSAIDGREALQKLGSLLERTVKRPI